VGNYRAKQAYLDRQTAAEYDLQRFRSRRGAWVDRRERSLMMAGIALLQPPRTTLRILDIPAGTGRLTADLLGAGHFVTAADISEEMLARGEHTHGFLAYDRFAGSVACDAEQLPFDNDSFDAVVSLRIAGHLPPPVLASLVAEFARVACLGVVIMFIRDSPLLRIRRGLRHKAGKSGRNQMWFPMRQAEIERLLRDQGWRVLARRGLLPFISESVLYVASKARRAALIQGPHAGTMDRVDNRSEEGRLDSPST
jgi:SAM-dependent methyltransferase